VTDAASLAEAILQTPSPLSEDQRNAVLSRSRYNRVIAGAGAGKTETITRRIAYLLLVTKVEPRSMVAFTFTEKAAHSMKSRVYELAERLAGSTGTARIGEMYIGTIHAYAKRILDDYFRYGSHSVLDDAAGLGPRDSQEGRVVLRKL
jgi:DNA helicase-2/ATP-dependent DNA helicase PcrA